MEWYGIVRNKDLFRRRKLEVIQVFTSLRHSCSSTLWGAWYDCQFCLLLILPLYFILKTIHLALFGIILFSTHKMEKVECHILE